MEIGIDSFAAAFDESSRTLTPAARLRHLIEQINSSHFVIVSETCAVCGGAIEPRERRFVDRNRITTVERHVHLACHIASSTRQPRRLSRSSRHSWPNCSSNRGV